MASGRAQSARKRGGAGVLLLALAGGGSCAAPPVPDAASAEEGPQETRRYDGRYEPAFAELRAALSAHDDELARRIVERILARRPDAATAAYAETFVRILDGRALARDLELWLVPSSSLAHPQRVRLELGARHARAGEVVFQSGPGSLRMLLTGVDARGSEQRVSRAFALPASARLVVPAGATAVVDLGEFEVQGARNLALQADWQLELRAGTLRLAGAEYPANEIGVLPTRTVRLAPWLPGAPVPPQSLAEYVAGGGRAMPALMERAVRVELDQREAALDALTTPALALSRVELALLVPALRWLSGARELGADAQAWRDWLAARAGERNAPSAADTLDLPETGARPDARVRGPGAEPRPGRR